MLKKRPFLLLELLIAISIFCVCIVPLAQIPTSALVAEIKTYQRLQLNRIADLTFGEIQTRLYQNQISWDELEQDRSHKSEVLKDTITIHMKGMGTRQIQRKCFIWSSSSKTAQNGDQYRLVNIQIELKSPSERRFFLFKNHLRDSLSFYHKVVVATESNPVKELPTLKS